MCGKCQSSRGRPECVYEDAGFVSFGGLGVPAEEVTVVPPSPTVLEFLNHSASMELNVIDFEDPFAFDAGTLSEDDLNLRLYVSFCLSQWPFLSLVRVNFHSAVSSSSPTVTRSECVGLSPTNRP